MGLTAMSSFSDAHECPEIPIIAANLHRLMQPAQSQIWAVLRHLADLRRTVYLLAGGFLGRLCLSGDFATLRPEQRAFVAAAIALYGRATPVIRHGRSYRHGPNVPAYRHAEGWQAVVRVGVTGKQALVVAHTFAKPGAATIKVPLPKGRWCVAGSLAERSSTLKLATGELCWQPKGEWAAAAVLLER
jgi:alpha-galactosidase